MEVVVGWVDAQLLSTAWSHEEADEDEEGEELEGAGFEGWKVRGRPSSEAGAAEEGRQPLKDAEAIAESSRD